MIGDVLASTIICEHIKENIAGAEVHYVVNSHTEAVVVNNPFIDRIILFAPKYRDNKFEFYRFLKDVRKEKYNVVIDAYGKLESNLISFFSGADIKISYPKWYSRFIYTHVVPKLNNSDTQKGLAIENRVKLLSPIIPTINNPDKAPKIYLTHEETIATKEFLLNNRIDLSKPLLMLGILGSGKDKTYPLGYMAKIINTIAEDYDVTMLFNYIPSQEKEAKELFNLCTKVAQHKIAINVFAPSLRSFLGLLSHCNAIVGNEGGAINMAKALDIPTFSVYSP